MLVSEQRRGFSSSPPFLKDGGVVVLSSSVNGAATTTSEARAFSSKCPTSAFLENGHGSPQILSRIRNRSVDLEAVESIPHLKSGLGQRSGLPVASADGGHSRAISTNANNGSPGGAEQPSSDRIDPEPVYPIFPSHNNNSPPPAFKPVRRAGGGGGVSIANAILDPGIIDVPYLSRASKLPLHSALPPLRAHRLGDPNFAGLQQGVAEAATASLPAGEAVDWQQQRLGRVKDQDARYRQPPSPPRSDAEPDDIFIPVKAFYISRRWAPFAKATHAFVTIFSTVL